MCFPCWRKTASSSHPRPCGFAARQRCSPSSPPTTPHRPPASHQLDSAQVHVVRNVLGALPKSVHAGARKALNEIILAEDRTHAERAIDAFAADYGVKWPKAVAKVTGETERLLCFFDYPAEHWVHLRTTNPIESSFAPVRARTRVTKGPGTKDMGLAMV